jgi:hypothetical protein
LADAALNSLDSLLGDQRNHSAFTKFGKVTVTQADLKLWGELWDIEKITNAECEHIATTLGGKEAPVKRQHGIRLLKTAIERIGVPGDSAVRKAMCDCGEAHDNSQLLESTAVWRGIQARQLFRLTLEALLYWATVEVSDRPSTVERMASRFLDGTPSESKVEAWLALPADPDAVDIIGFAQHWRARQSIATSAKIDSHWHEHRLRQSRLPINRLLSLWRTYCQLGLLDSTSTGQWAVVLAMHGEVRIGFSA